MRVEEKPVWMAIRIGQQFGQSSHHVSRNLKIIGIVYRKILPESPAIRGGTKRHMVSFLCSSKINPLTSDPMDHRIPVRCFQICGCEIRITSWKRSSVQHPMILFGLKYHPFGAGFRHHPLYVTCYNSNPSHFDDFSGVEHIRMVVGGCNVCPVRSNEFLNRRVRWFLSTMSSMCTIWGPEDSVQLVNIIPISLWFMVLITIVTGAYKPTHITNWGGGHIVGFWINLITLLTLRRHCNGDCRGN